ncbi:MAG: hypothetical protein ACRENE_31730 [Polyangiaceae bacterium]
MNRAVRAAGVGSMAAIAITLAGACVDLSPLDYAPPEGGLADAASCDVFSPDALTAACDECLSGTPSCTPAYKACENDPSCAKFALCMSTTACWSSNLSDLANLPPCLTNCAITAGVVSQNSSTSALISPLFVCAQDPARCKTACTLGGCSH